jgi:multiple sugar transport system permease protein
MTSNPAPKSSSRTSARSVSLTALMVVFLLYFLMPLFWLFVSSSKTEADLVSSFALWFGPSFNLGSNINRLFTFQNGVFAQWMGNTAFYAITSAIGSSLFATFAGYAFAKFQFPGRNLIFAVVLGSVMVPATTATIPLFLLLSKLNLLNTAWAMILPSLVNPFGVYLMRVYAEEAVPNELLEAARIDGASEGRIFLSIVSRILAPGFVTVLLFSFVGTWNNYFLPLLVFSKPELYPLTVGLTQWFSLATGGPGAQVVYTVVITGALVSIVPLIVAFLFLQRYWQSGLTVGSVKA